MGFEVRLIPVLEECAADGGTGSCTACFSADEDPDRYRVIYTRPKVGGGDDATGTNAAPKRSRPRREEP